MPTTPHLQLQQAEHIHCILFAWIPSTPFVLQLYHSDHGTRKQYVTLLRSRCLPDKGSRLYTITSKAMQHFSAQLHQENKYALSFVLSKSILSGYVLAQLLASNYTIAEVSGVRFDSFCRYWLKMS
jgi:hypothetical protein